NESTVTRGDHALSNYCINWVAGTNHDWLHESIKKEDVAGGFFARVIPVVSRPKGARKTFPVYPADYDEVVGHIRDRIEELSYLEGTFDFTARARDAFEKWDEGRLVSTDPLLAPSYERRAELVLKVAMILSVMEDPTNLALRYHHINNATKFISDTM